MVHEGYFKIIYIDKNEKKDTTDIADDSLVCIIRKNDLENLSKQNYCMKNKSHKNIIVILFIMAIILIISYVATLDIEEIIPGIEGWYNLFFSNFYFVYCECFVLLFDNRNAQKG